MDSQPFPFFAADYHFYRLYSDADLARAAIVFSGWPNVSYGTYGGEVVAIENFISDNGKYRVLLAPDNEDNPWPSAIRVGSGAYTMALLDDVPIWFELWRKINGFPPNFYQPENRTGNEKK